MYKTIWAIYDETEQEKIKTNFVYYHFGKNPQFPSWYFEEGHIYIIEMLWNVKIIINIKTFMKCLFHEYVIK